MTPFSAAGRLRLLFGAFVAIAVVQPLSLGFPSSPGWPPTSLGQVGASDDPSLRVPVEHWGCSNCHLPDPSNNTAIGQRPGPDLSGIGARNSADWLRRWIAKPADLRRVPTMPRLFGESAGEAADLDAVVQFLASLGGPPEVKAVASEEFVIAKGRELYHTIGCVNCHGALDSPAVVFGDEFLSDEVPSTFVFGPFGDLDGKWYPASLSAFLRDPVAIHRDGRMPNMGLDESESDAIANYLLTKWKPATAINKIDASKIARGREVLQERGCLACHAVEGMIAPEVNAPKLAHLDPNQSGSGCLSAGEWDGPRYDLPMPPLVNMLRGAVQAAQTVQPANARLDYLERQTNRLNCRACHEIDSKGGIAEALRPYSVSLGEDADLGDEGRFPPHLNGVGNKLTTNWFKQVLKESGTTRPYLATRMPQFGSATDGFPELFAEKDGVKTDSDIQWPSVTDEMLLLGREMVGNNGFGCVNCHSFGDAPALGTPGPDMQQFAGRLRYQWWTKYIENPELFKPGTRMPKYTDDEGRGVFTNFCDGDFKRQTDAMWAYFSLGEFMPAPSGIQLGGGLVLKVGDRPRVFRTYLKSAGSRGIAVGFPVGIHFAYDGASGRLMEVWQGEFLNASGAWAGRGGGTTGPEGQVLWSQPGGPQFLLAAGAGATAGPAEWPSEPNGKYRGYRLEKDGTPVFYSSLGEINIAERIVPSISPKKRLMREISLRGLTPGQAIFIRSNVDHKEVVQALGGTVLSSTDTQKRGWVTLIPTSNKCEVSIEVIL